MFNFTNWFEIAKMPEHKAVKPAVALTPFVGLKVLVAEDNMINQFMLVKMLKDWNAAVMVADNGTTAIEKFTDDDYDLVLMDTHMPGMNGYQAARAIRMDFEEPKRSVPIISLSAAAYEHEHKEAISAGMNDVLPKPFEPHELHSKIVKLVSNKVKKTV